MRWRAGERPKKSWMSCAVFWTSTRGEADEQLRELDFAGTSADARLDLVAFPLARGGAGGSVAVATAVCRSAPARYALAVSALVLMMVSPVITFTWLRTQMNPTVQTGAEGTSTWAGTSTQNATALSGSHAPAAASRTEQ